MQVNTTVTVTAGQLLPPLLVVNSGGIKGIFTILKNCLDKSDSPEVLMWTGDFSRSRWQVIRSYWVHLWCSPSAGCNQSAGRWYQGAAALLLRWMCVFRESTPSVGSLCFLFGVKIWVECLRFLSFVQFLYILFPPLISDSYFTFGFWVQCFLFVYHFDRFSGWWWVLFPLPPFRHQATTMSAQEANIICWIQLWGSKNRFISVDLNTSFIVWRNQTLCFITLRHHTAGLQLCSTPLPVLHTPTNNDHTPVCTPLLLQETKEQWWDSFFLSVSLNFAPPISHCHFTFGFWVQHVSFW